MKVLLFLVVSGISNGTDTDFRHQLEKSYNNLEECVQTSIVMRKVLHAEDTLQARNTNIYAHCDISQEGISASEYNAARKKIRRLEKFYTSSKW